MVDLNVADLLKFTRTWVVLPVLMGPSFVSASTDVLPASLFTEEDYLSDIPEVVSATRISQKLTEVPAAITLIDRDTIDTAGVIEAVDLFRLVPGMQVFHVSTNKFGATYHGLSDNFPRSLEVMVDGRSIYLPMLSTVDWGSLGLTLDDISHIEVVRGSNVPAYGSNAFLGAINIVTRSPLEEEGGSVTALAGEKGTRNVEMRHASTGEDFNYRISAGHRSNNGGEAFGDSEDERFINLSSSFAPTLSDTVDLQLGATGGYVNVGDGDDSSNVYQRRDNESNYQYIKWNRVLDADQDLQVTFYRNYLDLDSPLLTSEEVIAREFNMDASTAAATAKAFGLDGVSLYADSEHGINETYDVELQYTGHLSDRLSLILGSGYRFESATSETLIDSSTPISEERGRAFASAQWRQNEHWLFNAGVMYENSSVVSGGRYSPRVAANYLVSPNTSLRAAFTKAYRMPSVQEANSANYIRDNQGQVWDVVAEVNKHLKPEQIESYELGLYTLNAEKNTELDVRIFHERVRDALTNYFYQAEGTDNIQNASRKENTKQWEASGIEFQYKLRPWQNGALQLNYGFLEADGYRDRGIKLNGTEVQVQYDEIGSHVPQHTFSMLLSHQFDNGLQASTTTYYMDDVVWVEGGKRDSYRRTDMRLAKSFALDNQMQAEVSLLVQNVFNREYPEFYSNNRFSRSAYVKLKVKY